MNKKALSNITITQPRTIHSAQSWKKKRKPMHVPAELLKPETIALRWSYDARYSLESKAKKVLYNPQPRNGVCTYVDPRLEPRKPSHWRPSPPSAPNPSMFQPVCGMNLVLPHRTPAMVDVVVVGKVWKVIIRVRIPFEEFEAKLGSTGNFMSTK